LRLPAAAVASLVLAAAPAPAAAPAAQAGSALERFFIGATEGSGTVQVMLSGRHSVRDRSRGRMEAGGVLIIDQVVEEEGKPARRRSWRLVRAGGAKVTGTISDAKGPVQGEIAGQTLHLKYRLAEGPSVEQWITLDSSGRSAQNRMVFHKFGIKVATVQTVLRKVD
jgi:hypothetical protein